MDFSTRPRARRAPADVALVAVAGLALVAASWDAWAARREREHVRSSLAEVQGEVAAAQGRLRSLGARRGGDGERLVTRQELTTDAPPRRLLADITALLPEGVRLRSASFVYKDVVEVDLDVEARSPAAWDDFLERLSRSSSFTAVRPAQEQRDGEMRSAVRMTWSGGRS